MSWWFYDVLRRHGNESTSSDFLDRACTFLKMAGSSRSHRFWVPTPLPCPPPTLHATMIPGRLLRTSGCNGTTGCCPSIFHRLRKASNNISPESSPAQQSWADGGSHMAMECYGCYGYGIILYHRISINTYGYGCYGYGYHRYWPSPICSATVYSGLSPSRARAPQIPRAWLTASPAASTCDPTPASQLPIGLRLHNKCIRRPERNLGKSKNDLAIAMIVMGCNGFAGQNGSIQSFPKWSVLLGAILVSGSRTHIPGRTSPRNFPSRKHWEDLDRSRNWVTRSLQAPSDWRWTVPKPTGHPSHMHSPLHYTWWDQGSPQRHLPGKKLKRCVACVASSRHLETTSLWTHCDQLGQRDHQLATSERRFPVPSASAVCMQPLQHCSWSHRASEMRMAFATRAPRPPASGLPCHMPWWLSWKWSGSLPKSGARFHLVAYPKKCQNCKGSCIIPIHSRHRGGKVFNIFENMNQVDGLSLISMPLMFPPGTLIPGLKKKYPILFWLVASNPSPKYESHLKTSSRGPRREQVNKNPGFLVIFPFIMYSIQYTDENPHCWTKHSLVSTPKIGLNG